MALFQIMKLYIKSRKNSYSSYIYGNRKIARRIDNYENEMLTSKEYADEKDNIYYTEWFSEKVQNHK